MFETEGYEWTEKNISVGISMYNPSIEMYCGKAFKDGAEFGYNKAKEDVKDIIVRLVENKPDSYSGTDIEFNQKRMFKFSKAVSDAQDYLKGVL